MLAAEDADVSRAGATVLPPLPSGSALRVRNQDFDFAQSCGLDDCDDDDAVVTPAENDGDAAREDPTATDALPVPRPPKGRVVHGSPSITPQTLALHVQAAPPPMAMRGSSSGKSPVQAAAAAAADPADHKPGAGVVPGFAPGSLHHISNQPVDEAFSADLPSGECGARTPRGEGSDDDGDGGGAHAGAELHVVVGNPIAFSADGAAITANGAPTSVEHHRVLALSAIVRSPLAGDLSPPPPRADAAAEESPATDASESASSSERGESRPGASQHAQIADGTSAAIRNQLVDATMDAGDVSDGLDVPTPPNETAEQ